MKTAASRKIVFKREPRPIPQADWSKLTSEAAAIAYAMTASGLQDKSIAYETDIDPSILSKAKTGLARLNSEDLNALMDITGCEAPMYWSMLSRGYDPSSARRIETDVERENRELRERIATLEHDHAIEMRGARKLMAVS